MRFVVRAGKCLLIGTLKQIILARTQRRFEGFAGDILEASTTGGVELRITKRFAIALCES